MVVAEEAVVGRGHRRGQRHQRGSPDGVSERTMLKDFPPGSCAATTPEQIAAFRKVAQYNRRAGDRACSPFREALRKGMSVAGDYRKSSGSEVRV